LIGSIFIGWYGLELFSARARYGSALTELIKAENRFEVEVAWAVSDSVTGEHDPRLSRDLDDTYRDLVAIYGVIRAATGKVAGASNTSGPGFEGQWKELAIGNGGDLAAEKSALNLTVGDMPPYFRGLWDGDEQNPEGLEHLIGEVIAQGYPIVQAHASFNAQHREQAEAIEALSATKLRPALQLALDKIDDGTSYKANTTFYVLFACCLVGIAIALVSVIVIFLPMERAVLASQALLVRDRNRALALERAERDFLAMMSHELRTPLNGILGFSDLLRSTDLAPAQKDYAETIHSSGEMLLGLLDEILDLSKIEAGSLELEAEDFAISDVVTKVVTLWGARAFVKGLELSAYVDPTLPTMRGDAGRLCQILLNLVGNAIKFTARGGVAIEVKHDGIREGDGRDVIISVTDSGIGIPKDQLNRIFERFTQVDTSASRKYEGTGLGLVICKKLVQLMDGEIGVESVPDKGSTFWVRVRLADVMPAAAKISETIEVNIKGKRILVVDDHSLNRRIFRLQLKGAGAEVNSVPNARSALAALSRAPHKRPYDLAVIDHMMPGTDGVALKNSIRQHPRYGGLKLILSSAEIKSDHQVRALGFDAACPKPVIQEQLILKIHELLHEEASQPAGTKAGKVEPLIVARQRPENTNLRFLVAEDNPANQRLIKAMLERAGYSVDIVSDGVEAVKAAQSLPYDFIIMDIRMPVMNGIEATRRIRSMSSPISQRPILALTANAMAGDREECMAAGMTDYIAKPIDFELLFGKVKHYLGDGEFRRFQ
jgi:signal transduction histidine kinase/CheY-like chemotaxis protein